MNVQEQIDLLAALKPGWSGDPQYESDAGPNAPTLAYAKRVARILPRPVDNDEGGWTAHPSPDGSIILQTAYGHVAVTVKVLE